jgi:beta-lactamase superfamily II metal-dependent hydrolase
MSTRRLFSLEALNASEGDALLLHYGPAENPKCILVDGGPRGTYSTVLKKRLRDIGKLSKLELQHTIVTHLDSDHISGVLDMLRDDDCPAFCTSYWFNTFNRELLNTLPNLLKAEVDAFRSVDTQVGTLSVQQGVEMRDAVRAKGYNINGTRSGKTVLFADGHPMTLNLAKNHLDLKLVCPNAMHLRRLAADWASKIDKKSVDNSVYNLSSLVIVVQALRDYGPKSSMLLTGDARGDHILAGLDDAGMLDNDQTCFFNILKVPHHGSDRNLTPEFFRQVHAEHYVISANGRFENPSWEVLTWIAAAARHPEYSIWLTNKENSAQKALAENISRAVRECPGLAGHLRFRDEAKCSVVIDLWEPLPH